MREGDLKFSVMIGLHILEFGVKSMGIEEINQGLCIYRLRREGGPYQNP